MAYSVVTTTVSPASSADLVTLDAAKVELSIAAGDTSDDAWLAQAITQVSRSIARYCKRRFWPEVVQDLFDVQQDPYSYQTPGGFPEIVLSHWPVLSVASVIQTLSPGVTQTLTAGTDFRLDPQSGRLLRLSRFTGAVTNWEAAPLSAQYTAGFGQAVTETDVVPSTAPYGVTVSQAASFSCDAGVAYASGAALQATGANASQGEYVVDIATGAYSFAAADEGQALTFSYAVAAIPEDLQEVALRLITSRYDGKDRDSWLVQQDTPGVGTQRFWVGGTPGQKGPFPPDVTAALDEYRMPTVF